MFHLLIFMIKFLLNITVRKHFVEFLFVFFFLSFLAFYISFGWGGKKIDGEKLKFFMLLGKPIKSI